MTPQRVLVGGSFISPLVELYGDLRIGQKSFVAGNTLLEAETGLRLCIGNETNLQDNIQFLAQRRQDFPVQNGNCGRLSTSAGNQVSLAHQAIIINSTVGNFVFVGFHSLVQDSVLDDGVFITHGATVRGVHIAADRLVASGLEVTTQAQADALPLKTEANADFQTDVLAVNAEFAEGYAEAYRQDGFEAVTGASAAPRTTWNPNPVQPTLGAGVRLGTFARVVGDVRLGSKSTVGRRTSIRADEGAPIVIGANSVINDRVTFHALKGTSIQIGDRLSAGNNIVFHGPLTMGSGVSVGDDAVVFRSTIGNNVIIGAGALVIDVKLPDGAKVPAGAKLLKQADADALK